MTNPHHRTGDRPGNEARPAVGRRNRARLQILMASVALAFIWANTTSYYIGREATAAAARRTDARVSALETQVMQELNTRRATRDADTERFRADVCVLADRIRPRDQPVQQFRRRWGCTTPTR